MSEFYLEGSLKNKNVLIVSFGGMLLKMGGILPFEFLNYLSKLHPEHDKLFYIDKHQYWYNKGIEGISTNIQETVAYLKEKSKAYKKVVFMGISAGGYAAILFGSLLKVKHVLAFVPQTYIEGRRENLDVAFINLRSYINNSTQYIIYGDPEVEEVSHLHHFSHCTNIAGSKNVTLIKIPNLELKELRDSGEIKSVLMKII